MIFVQNIEDIESLLEVSKKRKELFLAQVKELKNEELMSSEAFLMGNDPIKQETLIPYQSEKPFLLVGTSMFGSILLASYLAKNNSFVPDVIIVDISLQVARCWELVKNYFATSEEKDTTQFVDDFIVYLQQNGLYHLSMDIWDNETTQELRDLLLKLISNNGFEYIKKMVNGAVIIKQSWGHVETFNLIREIYSDIDIYAYPSNIIHSIKDKKIQKDIASCVEALSPKLSIQTNLFNGGPTKVHLISDNTVGVIINTLGPGPFQDEEIPQKVNPNSFFASQEPQTRGVDTVNGLTNILAQEKL